MISIKIDEIIKFYIQILDFNKLYVFNFNNVCRELN